MAQDQVEVMRSLGFERFFVAGHDRGGRVGHRMALDHPRARCQKLAVLDIVPTHKVFATVDKEVATGYYHWFFLIQGGDLPETLIGHDPDYYLQAKLRQWSGDVGAFDPRSAGRVHPLLPRSRRRSTPRARTTAPPPPSISSTTRPTWTDRSAARCWCCGARRG